MIDVRVETIVDILQRANNVIHNFIQRADVEKFEEAYEKAYLEAVRYRNAHPRSTWTRSHHSEYNNILITFDIAKTDLMQHIALKNTDSQILY